MMQTEANDIERMQPPPVPAPKAVPSRKSPSKRERERMLAHIEAYRSQLEGCVRENGASAPDLAARARSLLLFLEGVHFLEIARLTGLSANAVMRVRRRFATSGMAYLLASEPSFLR